jgi:hypothetical protein
MNEAEKLMEDVMYAIRRNEKLSSDALLHRVADVERKILKAIKDGESEYFRRSLIKSPEAYTNTTDAPPYQQYVLWNEVFAPKYGASPALPYSAIKVSVNLDKPSLTANWLNTMKDQELANRMRQFLTKAGKKHIGSTMLLPTQCISSNHGIPEEIFDVTGARKIILDNTKVFYLILESLGIYINTDIGLISDRF